MTGLKDDRDGGDKQGDDVVMWVIVVIYGECVMCMV